MRLRTQYRMHESICTLIDRNFYGGKVRTFVLTCCCPLLAAGPSQSCGPLLDSTKRASSVHCLLRRMLTGAQFNGGLYKFVKTNKQGPIIWNIGQNSQQ